MYTDSMQNIDPSIIQQYIDQYTQSQGGQSTAPTINVFPPEFIALLSMILVATAVISVLFLIVYIIGTIRKWRVQSAILDIHRDVKELKASLVTTKPSTVIDKDTNKIA